MRARVDGGLSFSSPSDKTKSDRTNGNVVREQQCWLQLVNRIELCVRCSAISSLIRILRTTATTTFSPSYPDYYFSFGKLLDWPAETPFDPPFLPDTSDPSRPVSPRQQSASSLGRAEKKNVAHSLILWTFGFFVPLLLFLFLLVLCTTIATVPSWFIFGMSRTAKDVLFRLLDMRLMDMLLQLVSSRWESTGLWFDFC